MKNNATSIINSGRQLLARRWKIFLIILVLGAGVAIWSYRSTQSKQPTLTFEHPAYRDITKTLEVSGVVDADQKASMRFAAGGKVVYLGAKEGEFVEKYQTIASIDQRELQKRLKQDLNLYMKERWDFEGVQDEYDYQVEDLETRRMLDQEQWGLENEVLDVEIRDIAISNTYLTAPFAGILINSPTNVTGVTLLPSDTFELVNPDTLVFKAAVDEVDIADVNSSQSAQIFLDAYPDTAIDTSVEYISFTSNESSTGTVFLVKLPLRGDNLLGKYRIGMNGDVEIALDSREDALTVPFIATREREGKIFVDVRTGEDTYEVREITTGLETDEYVEVLDGLSIDDEILIPET